MRDLIRQTGLGPFHCGRVEILRRIFVTVRDGNWREIAPTRWNCTVEEATASIRVEARHESELIDFEWRGTLRLSADRRSVHFDFEGEARRTMDICRLGLVVLHPVETLLGARICATTNGQQQTLIVSSAIAPQPIIDGRPAAMTQPFSALSIERADLGLLELQFAGDLFEIEDQRNWGDASFKTYCTPLRLGYPREVKGGTRIAHQVDLRYSPARAAASAAARQSPPRMTSAVFPSVGREGREVRAWDPKNLGWHHVHFDLRNADQIKGIPHSADEEPGPLLEIGVEEHYTDNQWMDLVSWIAENRRRIARLLLYGAALAPPSTASLANCRATLNAAGAADLPIFAATRGYFVEFNRSSDAPLGSPVAIAFPLSATVHGDDALTIGENVATIVAMANTARLLQISKLALAPLALYYPSSPQSPGFVPAMIAPWLTATLMYAAIAGVSSITLAEDAARRAPVWLIEQLIRCAGRNVTVLYEQPKDVHAALLRPSGAGVAQVLGVNLNSTPSHLNLASIAPPVRSVADSRSRHPVNIDVSRVAIAAFAVLCLECPLD